MQIHITSTPVEIRLTSSRDALIVSWDDGKSSQLSAGRLRDSSRDAGALRARIDGAAEPSSEGLVIVDVKPVGTYAVNLFFSDGHDRGIFPWSLLRELADECGAESISTVGN